MDITQEISFECFEISADGSILNCPETVAASRRKVSHLWTKEEDELLERTVKENNYKCWKDVASVLYPKNATQCLHRWTKVLDPTVYKGPWEPEEDKNLKKLVQHFNKKEWSKLSEFMPRRNGKQCRERYVNHLDPDIDNSKFRLHELRILLEKHTIHGNKWTKLSELFHGRTDNFVKNFWNASVLPAIEDYLVERLRSEGVHCETNKPFAKGIASYELHEVDAIMAYVEDRRLRKTQKPIAVTTAKKRRSRKEDVNNTSSSSSSSSSAATTSKKNKKKGGSGSSSEHEERNIESMFNKRLKTDHFPNSFPTGPLISESVGSTRKPPRRPGTPHSSAPTEVDAYESAGLLGAHHHHPHDIMGGGGGFGSETPSRCPLGLGAASDWFDRYEPVVAATDDNHQSQSMATFLSICSHDSPGLSRSHVYPSSESPIAGVDGNRLRSPLSEIRVPTGRSPIAQSPWSSNIANLGWDESAIKSILLSSSKKVHKEKGQDYDPYGSMVDSIAVEHAGIIDNAAVEDVTRQIGSQASTGAPTALAAFMSGNSFPTARHRRSLSGSSTCSATAGTVVMGITTLGEEGHYEIHPPCPTTAYSPFGASSGLEGMGEFPTPVSRIRDSSGSSTSEFFHARPLHFHE